ncbi:MAG: hypothetical protein H9W81_07715 [Enterococcus sp.]|nr:hypothetical protein [Enterococcus sp.]
MATTTAPQTEEVQHLEVAEIETASGYRYWTAPMTGSDLKAFLKENNITMVSDWACSISCPACNA